MTKPKPPAQVRASSALALVRDLVNTLDEFVEEHSDPGTRALGVLSEARRFISTGGTGHVEDSPEVDAIAETINAVVGMAVPFPKLMAAARGVEKLIEARRAGAVPDTGQAPDADGSGPEEVWIPPSSDCMDHAHEPCPHCASMVFHHRTGRCGTCGRRPAQAPAYDDEEVRTWAELGDEFAGLAAAGDEILRRAFATKPPSVDLYKMGRTEGYQIAAARIKHLIPRLGDPNAEQSGDTVQAPDVAAPVAGSPVEAALAEIRTWLADDTPYCILPVRREHLPSVLARLDELEQQAAERATPAAPEPEDLFAVHPSPNVGKARERIADPAAYFERHRGAAEAALTAARAARARPSGGDPGLPLSALFDNRDPHQDEMRSGTAADERGPVYVKSDEELPHA